ncbi:hypothetical protein DKX38_029550 [Salix brachista]|uniref:Reverse transcriptase zinc-binding domain-containing protein n=1 Tax=Salix brachista TaxID=2182728 RepID=A0A5N5J115_9ROSI|nr:hypothetical protein DKX38_029550 [Salix brachista]
MHRLLRKLKSVKDLLKNYHKHNTSHISTRVFDAKKAWDIAQNSLDSNPTNAGLKEAERRTAAAFARLIHEEEAILKQRSRIQWLQLGDKNTAFFHKSIVHRQTRNKIMSLRDGENSLFSSQQDIGNLAADYFEKLLKPDYPSAAQIPSHIFPNLIRLTWPNHSWNALIQWAALHLKTNSSDHYLVARVILASVVYFIWLERNNQIFNQIHKPAVALASDITQLIRLHLASLQLTSPLSMGTKTRWGINEDPPPR